MVVVGVMGWLEASNTTTGIQHVYGEGGTPAESPTRASAAESLSRKQTRPVSSQRPAALQTAADATTSYPPWALGPCTRPPHAEGKTQHSTDTCIGVPARWQ